MTQPSFIFALLSSLAMLGQTSLVRADDEAGRAYYAEKVFPILKENCFKCHGGGDELKGDFRVTSREGLLQGGHYGAAYKADDPAASVLLEMVSYKPKFGCAFIRFRYRASAEFAKVRQTDFNHLIILITTL